MSSPFGRDDSGSPCVPPLDPKGPRHDSGRNPREMVTPQDSKTLGPEDLYGTGRTPCVVDRKLRHT